MRKSHRRDRTGQFKREMEDGRHFGAVWRAVREPRIAGHGALSVAGRAGRVDRGLPARHGDGRAARQMASDAEGGVGFFETLKQYAVPLLPNTAGCHTVQEVVTTAEMAREVFETDWIKLELIGDDYTLQPDPLGLVEAADQLIRAGFKVLPYCTEDLVVGRRLLDVGCQALMPWGAPIGTGKGIVNPYGLRVLRDRLPDVPLIVDAGLGVPSHACQVMEWGFDGVLLNTAVSQAAAPARMAGAFAAAVTAGRSLSGRTDARARQRAGEHARGRHAVLASGCGASRMSIATPPPRSIAIRSGRRPTNCSKPRMRFARVSAGAGRRARSAGVSA